MRKKKCRQKKPKPNMDDSGVVPASTSGRCLSPDIIEGITAVKIEKEKDKEVVEKETEENDEEDSSPKNGENDSSKIRRSKRIQKLETSRGGNRRREVVFSTERESVSNRSFDQDDDSNSNSNSGSGSGISASVSVPNLASLSLTSSLSEGASNAGIPSATSSTSFSQSSTMKLKSRWRISLDAESFKPSTSVDTANCNINVPIDSLSLVNFSSSGNGNGNAVSQISPESKFTHQLGANIITKPGHIVADSNDSELMEKLKKFEGIDENIFHTERYVSKEGRGMVCDCFLTREEIARGEIGCNEDCLNRLLMVECGSRCPTGDRCTNKAFQRKQYCDLEVFRTEQKGHGLRTMHPLPAGGFVIEYVGEVLDPRGFKQRTREYAKENQEHFYFMALKSDTIIDATLKGNCSRFINHSCEPNCETQKWTVNGELRIGFFAIKDLAAGEEITFDYQFQRYGKKAQQCFCLTPSCRGWIGAETEEDDGTKESGKQKVKAERKKRRDSQWEDISFEEELSKLETTGLRNKIQTLNLCRLMVRAEEWNSRERILNIIITGEEPCRRLFLDYHGLRLLWAWMANLPIPSPNTETQLIRDDKYHMLLLAALKTLPIPNKTILQDSKMLSIMEKWSAAPSTSTLLVKNVKSEVPETVSSTPTPVSDPVEVSPPAPVAPVIKVETEMSNLEQEFSNVEIQPVSENMLKNDTLEEDANVVEKNEVAEEKVKLDTVVELETIPYAEPVVVEELNWKFVETAKDLLKSWECLKEVFRIPKRERVEQMKKHERAADINESLVRRPSLLPPTSFRRDRLLKERKLERKVPVVEFSRDRERDYHHNRPFNRQIILQPYQPNLSKAERRHLFAERVAREEEEERKRRNQDEVVALHQERCSRLGLDAKVVPIVDRSCTYYLDPNTVAWKAIDLNDPTLAPELAMIVHESQFPSQLEPEVPDILTPDPDFVFPPWPTGLAPPPPLPPAILPRGWKMAVDDEGRCYYYDIRSRHSQWYPPSPESSIYNSSSSSEEDSSEEEEQEVETEAAKNVNGDTNIQIPRTRLKVSDRSERRKKSGLVEERIISPRDESNKPAMAQKSIRARKLQLMEQKIRQEALEAESLGKSVEEETSEVGDFESSGTEEYSTATDSEVESSRDFSSANDSVPSENESGTTESETSKEVFTSDDLTKREKEDLLPGFSPDESQNSSDTSEVKAVPPPTVDEGMSLVRGDTESKKLTPALNKLSEKKKSHKKSSRPTDKRVSDKDKHKSAQPKKTKSASIEVFRSQIANIIVQHLNPYRKPKCKHGRITSTEDFKHLARKMTHAIALKELKHCRDGKTLVVNESVKHKTKEYVKKYMAKYNGREYVKSPEEPPV